MMKPPEVTSQSGVKPPHSKDADPPRHTAHGDDSVPARPGGRWAVLWIILFAIPLVPFTIMTLSGSDPFLAWVRHASGGPFAGAVCFLLLTTDVFLPIPSSIVAIISGQTMGALAGGLINWTAMTGGSFVGFMLARRWGRPAAERWIGAAGLDRASRQWRLGAETALILSRPIPVLAEALAIHAGLAGYGAWRFLAITALANLPHSFIYSFAGARLGEDASLGWLTAAGVGAPTIAYLGFAVWRRM